MNRENKVLNDTGVELPGSENEMRMPEQPAAPINPKHHSQNSHLTDSDDVFDVTKAFNDEHSGGTIISDKKQNKRSLLSSIGGAFKEWGGSISNRIEKQTKKFEKPEEAKVVAPHARVNTIKAASTGASLKPTDDHTVVVKKITSKKPAPPPAPTKQSVVLKDKAVLDLKPSWTHVKNETPKQPIPTPPKPTRPAPAPHNLPVAPTVQSPSQPIVQPPKPPVAKAPDLPPTPDVKSTQEKVHLPTLEEVAAQSNTELPTHRTWWGGKKKPKQQHKQKVANKKPQAETDQPVPEAPKEEPKSEPPTEPKPKQKARIKPIKQPTPGILTPFVLMVGFLVVVLVGTTWTALLDSNTPVAPVTVEPVRYIAANTTATLALNSSDPVAFAAQLKDVYVKNETTHIVVTDSNGTPVTAASLFKALSPHQKSSFASSVGHEYMYGAHDEQPFIIIRTKSPEHQLGSLLANEPNLAQQLHSWLEGDTTLLFTDVIVETKPTRIGTDASGNQSLIYGLVDETTIVVTTNTETFASLATEF